MLDIRTHDEGQDMMGNASSQPSPPPTGAGRGSQKRKSSDPGNGKKRLYSNHVEHEVRQEEDTQASPLGERHPQTPESLQDYVAASAQLLAEIAATPTTQTSDAPRSRYLSRSTKQGERSHRRRPSVLRPSPDAGNAQVSLKKYSAKGPSKPDNGASSESIIENGLGTPNPTCSLDDIDENEAGLSSLFQEYEIEATQHDLPVPHSPTHSDDDAFLFDHDAIDPVLTNQSSKEKRKGKRKRRSSSSALGVGAEQEHLSGTGHDLPNGTAHLEQSSPTSQAEADPPSTWDGNTTEEERQEESLPQMASARRSHKRKRTEVPNPLDIQIPIYVSPYPPNAGQQDRVLPGIEDIHVGSSSKMPFSQPPGPHDGANPSPAHPSPKQTPPPPLENPSKTRGNKKQRGGRKGKEYNPPLHEMSEKGGMFSDREIKVLDSFRDRYCEENNESHTRFNELIQSKVRGNPEVTRLFIALHDSMPYRTRQSVMRFCRRHFHNFAARGVWSKADDIALKDAVAKKGNSWKAVGAMIDRFPEDCRDRYRNYLVNAEKRNSETWLPGEIRNLVRAVDFCMQLLREQRLRAKEEKYEGRDIPDSEPESDQEVEDMKLINWQVVSDRMGGTRSRLQCSYKWNHLKNADRNEYRREIRRLEQSKTSRSNGSSRSWRLRKAMKKLKNVKSGDKLDILQALSNCDAATESDIPWISLGSKELRQRWCVMDMKAALELFKGQVQGSEGMSYQEVVNRVLTRLIADDPGGCDDRWNPGFDGDVTELKNTGARKKQDEQNRALRNGSKKEKVQADKARRLRLKSKSGQKSKIKSTLFVGSDDEEESEEDRSTEPRGSNNRGEIEERVSSADMAGSAEEQSNRHASHEISVSDKEKGGDYSNKDPSIATTEDNDGNEPDDSPCPVRARGSPHGTQGDETSSDDSDDSLFNEEADVGSELVDQLQLLRDA